MPNNSSVNRAADCAVIIVAAGRGLRMGGGRAKQFRMLGGRPVFRWSLDAFLAHPRFAKVVLVVPPDEASELARGLSGIERLTIAPGGAERTDSVRAGLAAIAEPAIARILIHDAARPGVDRGVVDRLVEALDTHDAAAPVLDIHDAVKRVDPHSGRLETVDRASLRRIQTPQAFRAPIIREAMAEANGSFVDDIQLVETAGARIALVPGGELLLKITQPEDLAELEKRLVSGIRTGNGFDVHAFEPGDAVTLCGVAIPHSRKLKGHSDADVAWHALTDALLGAIAAGDIGDHFPPSDPQWRGAPSRIFLAHAVQLVRERGFAISNVDVTIMCEAPRVSPHRDAMRAMTAEVLELALDRVSVKATTTEKLGFLGRAEGIAAQASVALFSLGGS